MKLISRSEAKTAGLKRFYTGKLCRNGHDAERKVRNGTCTKCASASIIRGRLKDRAAYSAYQTNWYKNNASKVKDRDRKFREKNPERVGAKYAKYRKSNPELKRAIANARRARKNNAEGVYTSADIYALYDKQAGECNACPADLRAGYHVDHIIPLSRGGSNAPANLQLLCPGCNCSKGAKTMEEWRAA